MPIFLTVTMPSEYHTQMNGETYDEMIDRGRRFISSSWRSFRMLKINKKVRDKYGKPPPYYKVPEPHQSGVPHLHLVIYVPKEFFTEFKKKVKQHFSGHTKLIYKFRRYKNGTHGIIAYVAKYVSKLVRSLELDDVGVWYSYHRFRLFTTSRTLCPLYIHRKIKRFEVFHSLYDCTKYFENGSLHWNFDKKMLRFSDIGFLHWFPPRTPKKDLCFDMTNSESWQRHKAALAPDKKPLIKLVAHFDKDNAYFLTPVVPFAKMSHQELNAEYSKLKREHNPFSDFEVDRFKVCEKEYKKRFAL